MTESSEESNSSPSSLPKSRTRIGPKKAARIAAGEDRKQKGAAGSSSKPRDKKKQAGERNSSQPKVLSQGMASRKLALETLIKVEKDGAYANLALNAVFEKSNLSEQDKAFVTALVQGVVRNLSFLDSEIQSLSKEQLSKMPPVLRNLLRMAFFQLNSMSETPDHAVLDTSNKLARSLGHEGMVRYTNGVLRAYQRKQQAMQSEESSASNQLQPESDNTNQSNQSNASALSTADLHTLSLKFSLPEWLIQKWQAYYGESETLALLDWSQREPGFTARVSEVSVEPQTMLEIMNRNGFSARAGNLVPSCMVFEGVGGRKSFRGSPKKLPGFEDGFFVVQDEAAAFVSIVLSPQKGETIIDLCAAPGGKSVHIAEMLENTGRVVAVDKHESRLKLVKDVRLKQSLKNLETVAADGRSFSMNRQVDRVLLDAPCSGTGVINRRTDIRSHREAADLEQLTELQKELLSNAAKLVKSGGTLVYSTCSLEPEENIEVIQWFLDQHPEFGGSSLIPFLSEEIQSAWFSDENEKTLPMASRRHAAELGYIQLIPTKHGTAGFFICRMQKQ